MGILHSATCYQNIHTIFAALLTFSCAQKVMQQLIPAQINFFGSLS